MKHPCYHGIAGGFMLVLAVGSTSCAPTAPKVLLESPKDYPATWHSKKLYHTPIAYIYASNDKAAAETDAWMREIRDYIKRKHKADLEKGIVLVMEPGDPPVAPTMADELALERNPELMRMRPRRLKSIIEVRAKLKDEGVPEIPMVRGATIPLPHFTFEQLGLAVPSGVWTVAAPSHELAVQCGMEVGAAVIRNKRPDLTEDQAKRIASMTKNSLAKAFEIGRGNPVFELWVQRQSDWTYEQKRDAVLARTRYTLRSNGLPPPKEDDFDW